MSEPFLEEPTTKQNNIDRPSQFQLEQSLTPNETISTSTDVSARLEQLKSEIVAENVNSTTESVTENNKQLTTDKKPGLFRRIFNSIRYPPDSDRYMVRQKIFAPAFAGAIASSIIMFGMDQTAFINFMHSHQNLTAGLILGNTGLLVASGAGMIGASLLEKTLSKMERRNRIPFSNLLTSSKAFANNGSILGSAIRKNDPQFSSEFVGELHFVGINKDSWKGIDTTLDTTKDGFEGLHNLAVACEKNDQRVEGIRYFGGISPLINPSFKKVGFEIYKPKDVVKPTLFSRILNTVQKLKTEKIVFPNGHTYGGGETYVGIISRENLIKNKDEFSNQIQRIEKIKGRQESRITFS